MRILSSSIIISLVVALGTLISAEHQQTDPSNGVVDHHATIESNNGIDPRMFGSMPSGEEQSSLRHRVEKAHLMKKMNQKQGQWGSSHPRYRLLEALYGYSKYRERNMAELDRWRSMYKNLSKRQKKTLESAVNYKKKLDDIEELIYRNEALCKSIMANAMAYYGIEKSELDAHIESATKVGRKADKTSVTQTLKHFVRDWAVGGIKERTDAFPCIRSMMEGPSMPNTDGRPLKVLLPGAGLGRLAHEVASISGYEITINEWSMYMNTAYRYLQNHTELQSLSLYPFIDSLSHQGTTEDLHRKVTFPDFPLNPNVLLVEGDFNTAFSNQYDHYDIIVTHFFIDTARNLMSYFETIQRLLKKGGRWINFGPLLYGTGPFVQLSLDEIINVIEKMGFEFEDISDDCGALTFEDKKVRGREAEYGFNDRALTKNAYKAQAWVARNL